MSAQALESLSFANEIRMDGAQHRREIAAMPRKDGLLPVADLLRDPPLSIQRMRVSHLLTAVDRVGAAQANKLLRSAEINHPQKQIGPSSADHNNLRPLSSRQRACLILFLRDKAASA